VVGTLQKQSTILLGGCSRKSHSELPATCLMVGPPTRLRLRACSFALFIPKE
jgi:hypothetical protein